MRVLNLFAYTGCATMMASFSGATEVVHVDASKGINEWNFSPFPVLIHS